MSMLPSSATFVWINPYSVWIAPIPPSCGGRKGPNRVTSTVIVDHHMDTGVIGQTFDIEEIIFVNLKIATIP